MSGTKESSQRLRRLTETLRDTRESITDAFIALDTELRFTYVNAQAEQLIGVDRKKLLGKHIARKFPRFAGSEWQRKCERALKEGGSSCVDEYWSVHGKWVTVTVRASAEGLALFIRDITRSRAAQQALAKSDERYRVLFETSVDGIVTLSADARVCRANRAACRMFGRTETEMRTLLGQQLVSPADSRLQILIQSHLESGGAFGELTMLRASGATFEAEVSTSTFTGRDEEAFVNIVIRDATERIKLRQRLVAANAELESKVCQRTLQLERANSELKDFARSLAHDLHQPLIAIKAFSFALANALNKAHLDEARQLIGRVGAAAQQTSDYVDALLAMARVSEASLDLADVNLTEMAMGLLQELQEQDRSRDVVCNVQQGLRACGDPRLLRMLLQNLLANAWKFTSRSSPARISFTAQAGTDGELVYSVSDNGAGFDMVNAEKLFVMFQRLHSHADFPGTGIGLVNAQRIVLRHGGRIWAASCLGEGATFYFTLAPDAAGAHGAGQK